MRPLDKRLLQQVRPVRGWILTAACFQVVSAVLIVAMALLLAEAVTEVAAGAQLSAQYPHLLGIIGCFLGRAGVAYLADRFAHRASSATVASLRHQVAVNAAQHHQQPLPASPASLTTMLTSGLEAMDGYLIRYLPQLIATALITPGLLVVVLLLDPLSAVIMAVTLPLVPLFMALVGWMTQRLSTERIARMRRLGEHVLDVVAGLPTLRALGRARQQTTEIRRVGEAYRRSTSQVMRVAFLSGLVLEVLTTLCVALVAVGIGMRLVYGNMEFSVGLAVLILAPEVYLPLRLVGQHFHASTDGIAATAASLDLMENLSGSPSPTTASLSPREHLAPQVTAINWNEVAIAQPGRALLAPAHLTGQASAGRITALVGENGSGKSSLIAATLGLRQLQAGSITVTGTTASGELAEVKLDQLDAISWHHQVAWVPQHPAIVAGSVLDNIELIVGEVTSEQRQHAAARSGFAEVVAQLPQQWHTLIGEGGVGLSAGQRQRLALTRALLRVDLGARVVIMDEPSAHIDADTEAFIALLLRELADAGVLVVLVAHRPQLAGIADSVITVSSAPNGDSPDDAPEHAGDTTQGTTHGSTTHGSTTHGKENGNENLSDAPTLDHPAGVS